MSNKDHEIKALKRNTKKKKSLEVRRSNLGKLEKLDDHLPFIKRIEEDINSPSKHIQS
jgi:hypothetical protein